MKNDGCNSFKNSIFDKHEWTAGVYDTPERIIEAFNSLKVCGKRIVGINAIGVSSFSEGAISSVVWRVQYEAGVPYEIAINDKYEYRDKVLIPCEASICEPVILAFDDGSTFELQPGKNLSLKMSTNQISKKITDGINHSNFESNVVFRELLGSSLKQLTVLTFHKESVDNNSTYKEEDHFRRYIFWTQGEFGFSITHRRGGWYQLELRNQKHFTHDGIEIIKKPYEEIQKSFKPIRQIVIIEGHDCGACFWIMPVKQLTSRDEGDDGVEEFREEEISINEDYVLEFLYYFLGKYFDEEFEYIGGDRSSRYSDDRKNKFEWYLEHNIYSYSAVRAMIAEIRNVAEMLQRDFDNPALDEVKSRFSTYTFSRDWNICTARDMTSQEKNEIFRASIDIAIDFYGRFCRRMDSMMKHAPQYDQISFMGP